MTIETLRHFFGWCAVINYAMLILWLILQLAAHGFFVRLSQRFFGVGAEKYDSISLKAMFFFKLSIWLFTITPYLALRIIALKKRPVTTFCATITYEPIRLVTEIIR